MGKVEKIVVFLKFLLNHRQRRRNAKSVRFMQDGTGHFEAAKDGPTNLSPVLLRRL
jgi:hypothetical protein